MYTLAAGDTLQGVAGTGTAITYTIFGMELYSGQEAYKKLAQGQLPTSPGALYTTSALTTAFIKNMVLCNTTASVVSGICLFASGSAAANQMASISIPGNGQAIIDDFGIKVYDSTGSAQMSISGPFDAIAPPPTTPGTPSSVGVAATAARRDHTHQGCGGIASLVNTTSPISTTETQVISAAIPANMLNVGTTFRITVAGTATQGSQSASTFRCRFGPAGNNTDNIPAVFSGTSGSSGSAVPFYLEMLITVRTIGAAGSVLGGSWITSQTSTAVISQLFATSTQTSTVAINTTVQNYIQLTFLTGSAANSATFYVGAIEVVKT